MDMPLAGTAQVGTSPTRTEGGHPGPARCHPHPLPPLRPPVPGTLEPLLPSSGSSAHLTSIFESSVPLSHSKEGAQVGHSDGATATGSAGPRPFSSSKEVWEVRDAWAAGGFWETSQASSHRPQPCSSPSPWRGLLACFLAPLGPLVRGHCASVPHNQG